MTETDVLAARFPSECCAFTCKLEPSIVILLVYCLCTLRCAMGLLHCKHSWYTYVKNVMILVRCPHFRGSLVWYATLCSWDLHVRSILIKVYNISIIILFQGGIHIGGLHRIFVGRGGGRRISYQWKYSCTCSCIPSKIPMSKSCI